MAKAEMSNTVYLCSSHVCTVDFIPKPFYTVLLSVCVCVKVVLAKAELNNNIHPLYTSVLGLSKFVLHSSVQLITTWCQPGL
jgi:hypothetical protein